MRTLIFIPVFAVLSLYSCKSGPIAAGQTNVHFEPIQYPSISKEKAAAIDSCVLRFRSEFNNDTIRIDSPGKNKEFIVASTKGPIAFATSVTVKKRAGDKIQITIAGTTFIVPVLREYVFIDIDYRKDRNTVDIYYSNNMLVLS